MLGAVTKCKQYTGITVKSGKHAKSVKITSNMFAVYTVYNTSCNVEGRSEQVFHFSVLLLHQN